MPTLKFRCKSCQKKIVPCHVETRQIDLAYTAPGGTKVRFHSPGGKGKITISSPESIRIEGTLTHLQEQLPQGIDALCPHCNITHYYTPEDYLV